MRCGCDKLGSMGWRCLTIADRALWRSRRLRSADRRATSARSLPKTDESPPWPGRLQGRVVWLFVLVGGLGVVCVRCLVGVLVSFGLRGGWGLVSPVR